MADTDIINIEIQDQKRLEWGGKIEVITGGNSGIGLATAQRFVQEGAYVFIIGRRQDELDKAVKQIGSNEMNQLVYSIENNYSLWPFICYVCF